MNPSPALLQTHGLVKRFGGLLATDQASLAVREGTIHALIGPNGAGKTTLIHLISGAQRADAGTIEFAGQDISAWSMQQRVRQGLVRSYQITSIFKRLSVLDNLALALPTTGGALQHVWRSARADRERHAKAAALAQRIGLAHRLDQVGGALSHGEQRQLELGLALATGPRIMLLDEPMAGMGPDESERMVRLLQSLRGEITLLLVEHDMDSVFRLADTISTLVYGQVIATGTPDEIRRDPAVRRAYLGETFAVEPS